jgi:hypothetical protein
MGFPSNLFERGGGAVIRCFSIIIHACNLNTEECRLLGYVKPSLYLTGDTLRLHYRAQPVNAV